MLGYQQSTVGGIADRWRLSFRKDCESVGGGVRRIVDERGMEDGRSDEW